MNGVVSVNLSSGNRALCRCCKGLKTLSETAYSPAGTCTYCNGTGFREPLRNVDSEGLPPNNHGS